MSVGELDPPLDSEAIAAALAGQLVGHRIIVLEQTTSTNDVVAEMAPSSDEGLVVFAETQTAARGQYGRHWESQSRKGLWLSILLLPDIPVSESARLTDLLARAIAVSLEAQSGIVCAIKPPNDVYAGARKIAGVLVEMRVAADGGYVAIAGLGLNVNHTALDFPPELRATAGSVAISTGAPVDRTAIAIALLREIDRRYAALAENS